MSICRPLGGERAGGDAARCGCRTSTLGGELLVGIVVSSLGGAGEVRGKPAGCSGGGGGAAGGATLLSGVGTLRGDAGTAGARAARAVGEGLMILVGMTRAAVSERTSSRLSETVSISGRGEHGPSRDTIFWKATTADGGGRAGEQIGKSPPTDFDTATNAIPAPLHLRS
eukprot:Hpha_TRINITY_DN16840_c4_g2::TRINITY_DN16840_c4_g2_i1::g.152451::m.152451